MHNSPHSQIGGAGEVPSSAGTQKEKIAVASSHDGEAAFADKGTGESHEVFQADVEGVNFRTVSWQRATVVFLKINFAMSILAIPGALAALGSVGGSLTIVGFTALNVCT